MLDGAQNRVGDVGGNLRISGCKLIYPSMDYSQGRRRARSDPITD